MPPDLLARAQPRAGDASAEVIVAAVRSGRNRPRRSPGRGVGRSAAGRAAEPHAVELAVIASIRHRDTSYDDLLMSGVDRAEARDRVSADVDEVLERWRHG